MELFVNKQPLMPKHSIQVFIPLGQIQEIIDMLKDTALEGVSRDKSHIYLDLVQAEDRSIKFSAGVCNGPVLEKPK